MTTTRRSFAWLLAAAVLATLGGLTPPARLAAQDKKDEERKGTVTGTVEKKGDKQIITVKEAKFD